MSACLREHAALEGVLQGCSPSGLQGCIDYVMFPLLMMLDSIASTRQRVDGEPETGATAVALPAMSSDRAAEAAVACLRCLLQRCSLQAGESLVAMLSRLAAILQLPTTSEELRLQASKNPVPMNRSILILNYPLLPSPPFSFVM